MRRLIQQLLVICVRCHYGRPHPRLHEVRHHVLRLRGGRLHGMKRCAVLPRAVPQRAVLPPRGV
jgi:hypothetical protein